MKTLKTLITEAKCRKGTSVGTTKHGAFWLAVEPIHIRSFGGDGVGNSATNCDNYLQLRHYRDGTVKAVVNYHGWHQNHGTSNQYQSVDILDCITVEDVIVVLKGSTHDDTAAYGNNCQSDIEAGLIGLGMLKCSPSPDEEPEARHMAAPKVKVAA